MNEEINIYHILKVNGEAYAKGEKLPYTKQQYIKSKYGDNSTALFFWNLLLPDAEPYTKQEHAAAVGCDALAIFLWNSQLPDAEPYTKQEHAAVVGCNADAKRRWNECLPDAEPFTEDEINNSKK